MKSLTENMGIWAAVVMIFLAVFVYKSFFSADLSLITVELPTSTIGSEVLTTLATLQTVTLNQNIFSTNGFQMLIDFSVAVPPQPTGRPNPFSPIGR